MKKKRPFKKSNNLKEGIIGYKMTTKSTIR